MKAEEQLQFMMDFYPELYPTRKHCLNQLFCTVGNGYEWKNGELVDEENELFQRYQIVKPIKMAKGRNEEEFLQRMESEKRMMEEKGSSYRITPYNVQYHFKWHQVSEQYSKIFNYPADITEDWYELLKECERMLIEDGVIQTGSDMHEGMQTQTEEDQGMHLL